MKINQKLLEALETRGLSEPTLAQSSTWPVIDTVSNVLLIAPTGVGKTEAAIVPLFHRLLEKEAKPIVAKRPFIIVGSKDHLKAFRKLGFKTFSPVIDESYDDEPNKIKRFNMILDAMDKLTEQDPQEVYKKLQSVLDYNYNHFYSLDCAWDASNWDSINWDETTNWNKKLLDAWHQGQMPVI